jgi:hypothetical protein
MLVGSLNWLSVSTRPDIATITNMLAKYCCNPSKGHIDAALRVVKYLKGTRNLAISFSTTQSEPMQAFINFPLPPGLTGLCDANWGPQDQSKPNPKHPFPEIDIFKSRSISGFLTWINGPVM